MEVGWSDYYPVPANKGGPAVIRRIFMLLAASLLFGDAGERERIVERPDWAKFFKKSGVAGSIVIVDERKTPISVMIYNQERARQRFSPASTFKIPHTLFALEDGVVADEFQVFKWDGVARGFSGHNQDQNLRSAMHYSTLWVYQGFAKQIGEVKARTFLNLLKYGNADPSVEQGDYWVDGSLKISMLEQIEFLRKLFHNKLPFKLEHQRLVKDLMITQANSDWILRSKTGWEGRYGWWVGWIESRSGAVFFALNIETPRRLEDLPKRERIARAILGSLGLHLSS